MGPDVSPPASFIDLSTSRSLSIARRQGLATSQSLTRAQGGVNPLVLAQVEASRISVSRHATRLFSAIGHHPDTSPQHTCSAIIQPSPASLDPVHLRRSNSDYPFPAVTSSEAIPVMSDSEDSNVSDLYEILLADLGVAGSSSSAAPVVTQLLVDTLRQPRGQSSCWDRDDVPTGLSLVPSSPRTAVRASPRPFMGRSPMGGLDLEAQADSRSSSANYR